MSKAAPLTRLRAMVKSVLPSTAPIPVSEVATTVLPVTSTPWASCSMIPPNPLPTTSQSAITMRGGGGWSRGVDLTRTVQPGAVVARP